MAVVSTISGLLQFLGFSLHRRWFRIFAFPFHPPADLAFHGRKELFIAALCFAGAACIWMALVALTLTLLISIYDRQWYGFDIPFLILMGVFMMFSFIATSTALYLLVRTAFWRQRPFIELHGRRFEPTEIYSGVASCAGRTWRPEPWRPSWAPVKSSGAVEIVDVGIGQVHDPAKVERVGRPGLDYTCCILCRWVLCRSDDSEHGRGYTDGEVWLCRECFEGLVKPVQDRFAAGS